MEATERPVLTGGRTAQGSTVPSAEPGRAATGGFPEFVAVTEPALRRALVAAFGPEVGRDAAADALAWGWQHWDELRAMTNPAGYLFRTASNSARRRLRREARGRVLEATHADSLDATSAPESEPELEAALDALSERQRAAVLLVHGYGYTLIDAAAAMGCSPSTLRNHLARGLRRLRAALGVLPDA